MIGVLIGIVVFLMLAIAVLLTLLILFQDNKGGLTGALGAPGAESALGAKATERISRLTAYFAAAFMVLALVAAVLKAQERGALPGAEQRPEKSAPAGVPEALPAENEGDS